jgi:hypothetical protein
MAHEGPTPDAVPDQDDYDDQPVVPLVDDMRQELERAADDLERLTEQLGERTGMLLRFEALVDELLDLMPVPVVLLDENARVAGLSRGAADLVDDPAAALGRAATSVLPSALSREVTAYVRETSHDGDGLAVGGTGNGGDAADGDAERQGRRAQVDGTAVRFLALPDRTTLVVVDG